MPVGYADGFRRDMTGTEILVAGERARVVGAVSMDALAVELTRELPAGEPVTLLGDGITVEGHAAVAGTIGYEIACGLNTRSSRAVLEVVGMSGNVDMRLELQQERNAELAARVDRVFGPFRGDERALDSGCGAGALAFALAPHVREVIGIDLLRRARRRRAGSRAGERRAQGGRRRIASVRATANSISPGASGFFTTRAGRSSSSPSSRASRGPVAGSSSSTSSETSTRSSTSEIDRFEQARDPSHTRLLPDTDIRSLLDANDLVVESTEVVLEKRELEWYLDLAGVEGEARRLAELLAPGPSFEVEVGWYVARKGGH